MAIPLHISYSRMEFLSHFLKALGFMFLPLLYIFIRRKLRSKNKKGTHEQAPVSSGAWPLIGHLHLLRGRTPVARILGAMSDRYGSIYCLKLGNRRALVVSSWEMVKECFTINDKVFATRPPLAVAKYIGYKGAGFAVAPYGPYWRDVRKMVTLELFTAARLEKLKRIRASEMDYFIRDLHLLCGKNGNIMITKLFEHLTFNITVRMVAGKRFTIGSSGEAEGTTEDWRAKQSIHKALYLSGLIVVSDVVPSLEWLDIGGHLKSMKQTAKELDLILEKWLEEHKLKRVVDSNTDGEADFMDVMLSTLPEDTVMSGFQRDTVIKATTLILILTGTESTAETLTWALSLLLNNRNVLEIVQDELDVHVGRNKRVQESDIVNLPYLQAVVKETLRMYPPGPLAGPHEAMEDCYVGGYHVPKGTRLIVNVWKLHRDPRVWSDNPDKFRPERFIEEHCGIKYLGQDFEYIPFSAGRRMCPASTFALQVVHLALARLLQGFEVSTPTGEAVDMREGLGIALPKVEPLEVRLMPRLPLELYQNL